MYKRHRSLKNNLFERANVHMNKTCFFVEGRRGGIFLVVKRFLVGIISSYLDQQATDYTKWLRDLRLNLLSLHMIHLHMCAVEDYKIRRIWRDIQICIVYDMNWIRYIICRVLMKCFSRSNRSKSILTCLVLTHIHIQGVH